MYRFFAEIEYHFSGINAQASIVGSHGNCMFDIIRNSQTSRVTSGGGLVTKSCSILVSLWTVVHQALCPWDFPGKNTGVGSHFLLQGIFLTQGSNPGLLHCRQILYQWRYQGSPQSNYIILHFRQQCECFSSSHPWQHLVLSLFFSFNHFDKYIEVTSVSIWIFLITNDVEHLFMCLFAIWIFCSVKCLCLLPIFQLDFVFVFVFF